MTDITKSDNKCSTHQKNPSPGYRCETCARIRLELRIMRKTIEALIGAGYFVTIDNGGDEEIRNSQDIEAIMKVVFLTDEDYVYVGKKPIPKGQRYDHFVRFIYGNDGWDVINDYSTALEKILKPVNDYADKADRFA